jgi:hypothetical protein
MTDQVMTDQQIIKLLFDTGHLNYPGGVLRAAWCKESLDELTLTDRDVRSATASYQDMMSASMEALCLKHHFRSARADGVIGPAFRELLRQPRCGCPDYGEVGDHYHPLIGEPKQGSGNWPGCHNIGDFHAAKVYIDDRLMPSFLKPVFEEIWGRVEKAFQEIGLQLIRTENKEEAEIVASFVRSGRGWIGLAIVGRGKGCGSQIWCQYSAAYNPRNTIASWVELLMHEFGHNLGLLHTSGGVMNAYLITGLPPTWDGDISRPILARLYGGEPIPSDPVGPEAWDKYCFRSNYGREVCVDLFPALLVTDEEKKMCDLVPCGLDHEAVASIEKRRAANA